MRLQPKWTVNNCTCGCEHPVLRQDSGIHGTPMPGGYILCGKCGRRTRKHHSIKNASIAWNSNFKTEIYNEFSLETQILKILCKQRCFLHGSWYPVPCTLIAKELGKSVYAVRNAMHTLVDQGYAAKSCYTLESEDVRRPVHGWVATEKAKLTQVYEDAAYREAEARESCFHIPKKETLNTLIPNPRRHLRDT